MYLLQCHPSSQMNDEDDGKTLKKEFLKCTKRENRFLFPQRELHSSARAFFPTDIVHEKRK